MIDLTTESVTQAVEATVETITDAIPEAAQATLSLSQGGLRILQGILMIVAGASLWVVATILLDIQRSGALDTAIERQARRLHHRHSTRD